MKDTEDYIEDGNPANNGLDDMESVVMVSSENDAEKLPQFLERIAHHSNLMVSLMEKCKILLKDREIVLEVPDDLSEQIEKELELNRKNADFLKKSIQDVFGDHYEILFRHPVSPEMEESFNRKLDIVLDLFDGKILD